VRRRFSGALLGVPAAIATATLAPLAAGDAAEPRPVHAAHLLPAGLAGHDYRHPRICPSGSCAPRPGRPAAEGTEPAAGRGQSLIVIYRPVEQVGNDRAVPTSPRAVNNCMYPASEGTHGLQVLPRLVTVNVC